MVIAVLIRCCAFQGLQEIVGSIAGIKPASLFDLCHSRRLSERLFDGAVERIPLIVWSAILHLCLVLSGSCPGSFSAATASASVLARIHQKSKNGGFAQCLASFETVQAFHQYETVAIAA